MFSTGRMKDSASCLMRLLFAALAMIGLFTSRTANSQSVYEATLHRFDVQQNDGFDPSPYSSLIMDSKGNLFGTTSLGGIGGTPGGLLENTPGTVFELVNNSGSYSYQILHDFSSTGGDGVDPNAGLIIDSQGNLYGTTTGGGANGYGTVFELVNNSGTYSYQILHNFSSTGGDGINPNAGLIIDSQGNLYGTTTGGGVKELTGDGTVFELVNNSGAYSEKVLYSFTGGNDFNDVGTYAGLIIDSQGNLYGTTEGDSSAQPGAVFELVKSSGAYSEQILHTFSNTGGDGQKPYAGLIMDSQGNLYGTTTLGGANGFGTVFELVNNSGAYSEQILYSFPLNALNGVLFAPVNPVGGLIQSASGVIYGTAEGGQNFNGSVFELAVLPSGASPYSTSTSLTCPPNSVNPDATATIQCTAFVTSSSAPQGLVIEDGSVSIYYGTTLLGTSPVSNGTATLNVNPSAIADGTTTITAQYTPASSVFAGSSGQGIITLTEPGVATTNGNNTYNGNQTVNGTVSAAAFTGSGSGLTGVVAAGLNCAGCVTSGMLAVPYALGDAQGGNALNALNAQALGGIPSTEFAITGAGGNTFSGPQIVNGSIMTTGSFSGNSASFSGSLTTAGIALTPGGSASSSQAFNSTPFDLPASVYNSNAGAAQNYLFRWQSEPVAGTNDTVNPAATLNLLYGANGTPAETGLSVNANGTLNFASGQTFPGIGAGSVTGVTAGTGLSGGGKTGNVTLNLASNACGAGSALTALPFACSPFAGLGANSFSGNQTVTGTVSATSFSGNGAGLTGVNAATAVTATSATTAATATSATTATTAAIATTAATATNALSLGGNAPSYYAITGANTFTGNQAMPSLSVSGETTSGSIGVGGGTALKEIISITDSLILPAIASGSCTTFATAAVSGYTPGSSDTIALGVPSSLTTNLGSGIFLIYQAWETSAAPSPTITIQVCNPSGGRFKGGASGALRIDILKH